MKRSTHQSLVEYLIALGAVAASTVVSFAIVSRFDLTNLVMIYLLGTLAVAARGHRGPAALSSALGVLAFDFFFVPPRFTFSVADAEYVFTFVVMFAVAMSISHLTIRLRKEANAAREGERRTVLMHELTQALATARNAGDMLRAASEHIRRTFNASIAAFVMGPSEKFEVKTFDQSVTVSGKEQGVARWVYDRGEPAGLGASALPSESALYLPLLGSSGTTGVLRILPKDGRPFSLEQRRLLDSFTHQIALALEVGRLEEGAKEAELEAETERLRSSILSAVSHDFRTPLTAIVGSTAALIEKEDVRKSQKGLDLLLSIQSEAERLSRLVQNLLEATRLESGGVQLKKEKYPLEEIVGSALERLAGPLQGRNVSVTIPEEFPAIPMDGLLIEQVMINLLENAVRHTPAGTAIDVSASLADGAAIVSVADHGRGIHSDDLERVFEKFFRDQSSTGAGLGLAICRAIVNAHGGRIWVENREGGGADFRFALPMEPK